MNAEDEAVIQRVRRHHAAMEDHLDRLSAVVEQTADPGTLLEPLASLLRYWQCEVMPHAAAEEVSIYAAAARLEQAGVLVSALEYEHRDLRSRVGRLQEIYCRVQTTAGASTAGGHPSAAPELYVQALTEAAAAKAVFHVHADKENDFVLPALAAAGQPLPEIMTRMEAAFADARRAVEQPVAL